MADHSVNAPYAVSHVPGLCWHMGMDVSRTDTVPTLLWHFQNSGAEMQGKDTLGHSGLHVVESAGDVTGRGACHTGRGP